MAKHIESISDNSHSSLRGIRANMDREKYDSIARLNPSSIVDGIVDHREVDPRAVKCAFESTKKPVAQATKDRMDRGTLAHMMLLQPERLVSDVAVWHGDQRKGAEWDVFSEQNSGRLIIRNADYQSVSDACREFRTCSRLNQLLSDIDVEVAMFSQDCGVYTKGMVDGIKRTMPVILDLKTTEAGISSVQVKRTIRQFKYRQKMAGYKRWYVKETGFEESDVERVQCYNIFLNMVKPYGIRVIKYTSNAIEWGEIQLLRCIQSVANCIESNSWPMFSAHENIDVDNFETDDDEGGDLEFD